MLILGVCKSDLTSYYNGFQYPSSGMVECPDWDPKLECGNGLHGFAWGEGDSGLLYWDPSAKWMILKVEDSDVIDLKGKVKFPRGEVVFVGDQAEAAQYLFNNGCRGYRIVGLKMMVGDHSTLIGGDNSALTGGDYCILTGGDKSALTGGYKSTLTAGDKSILIGENNSILIGLDKSTLTGGNNSTLIGGYNSTLTGGENSNLIGKESSTLTGGYKSTLSWKMWEGNRYRIHTYYVGENGVEAGKAYKLSDLKK